jgi:hypothetical protein
MSHLLYIFGNVTPYETIKEKGKTLSKFFEHLDCQSDDIKFTMEVEENGTLGHQVFRKKTST